MKKIFYIAFIITLIHISFLLSEDLVTLAVDDLIYIYNLKGKLIGTKKLTKKLEYDITIKKDFAIYYTKPQTIMIENLVTGEVSELAFYRIAFRDKSIFGTEIYFSLDYAPENKELVFCVRPEEIIEIDALGRKSTYNFNRIFEVTKIFLYNLKDQSLSKIAEDEDILYSKIRSDKIIYKAGIDIIIKEKKSTAFYSILKEIHTKGKHELEQVSIFKIDKNNLIINSYDSKKKHPVFLIYDLKKKKLKNKFYINGEKLKKYLTIGKGVLDIGSNKNLILMEDGLERRIYLLNLENSKETFIAPTIAKGARFINEDVVSKWKNVVTVVPRQ